MSIRAVVDEFRHALRRVEVEFENSMDEVLMLKDVQKLTLPSGSIERIRVGASLRVHRWVAEKLIEKNLAKPVEEVLDLKSILQLRWRERSNPAELQPLPRYFYLKARRAFTEHSAELAPHLL